MQPQTSWMEIPPVFVLGCYRSGTSLVRLMLSVHPHVHISSETNYIETIGTKLHCYGNLDNPRNLRRVHEDILSYLKDERWTVLPSYGDLEPWVETYGSQYASLITFYGTWEARQAGKTDLAWWGDNSPRYVHCIPYLRSLFPKAKFIHMVRDPRDVVTSALPLPFGGKTGLGIAYDWERATMSGVLAELLLGPTVVKRVHYEDLVRDASSILVEVCDFLSVPFTDAMLNYRDTAHAKHLSRLPHHAKVIRPVSTESVGRYRGGLAETTVRDIEGYLCTAMRLLGYLGDDEYRDALGLRLKRRRRHYGWLAVESLKRIRRITTDEVYRVLKRRRR